MTATEQYDEMIAEIHGLRKGHAAPMQTGSNLPDLRHEEFRAMSDSFLGPAYDQTKLAQVEEEQVGLHRRQEALARELQAGEIDAERFADAVNTLTHQTLSRCETILGPEDFARLFGCDAIERTDLVDAAAATASLPDSPARAPANGVVSKTKSLRKQDVAPASSLQKHTFMDKIRNIAIIAHVDHGKTTLVDCLLRQSGTFRANQKTDERMMDSMDLEREKGITIRAKNAAFQYNGYHVNIVDTPGHADFGGEVERIMSMVDGVLLVVDAHDGPQAQTKFVLKKALEQGAKAMVVINKIDRENARPHKVLDMIFDLFVELNASDAQLDFPVVYASAKAGYAMREVGQDSTDMTPLYEAIIKEVPPPQIAPETYFQMLVSNLDYSDYLGRIAYGRILSGRINVGDTIVCIHGDGRRERSNVTAIFGHSGMEKIELKHASAGDIIGLAGFEDIFIGETLTDTEERPALHFTDIDPPTMTMGILVNDGPLAGREGKLVTARNIKERLVRETRTNVSLQFRETDTAGSFELQARGEMQIAILVEQMRREGFEVLVSRPEVIYRRDDKGNVLEPYETLTVDVPNDNLGDILQSLAGRRAEITNMVHHPHNVVVDAIIPTRGLIGFETDLVNATKGMGIMSHLFKEYGPHKGDIPSRNKGVLVAMEGGVSTAYALEPIQERGRLFIGVQEEIYEGMIIGECARPDDLAVNPCKAKKLNNMRSSGDGKGIALQAPVQMTLERSLEYIAPDEYVEATPKSLRMRKKILDAALRKRSAGAKLGA